MEQGQRPTGIRIPLNMLILDVLEGALSLFKILKQSRSLLLWLSDSRLPRFQNPRVALSTCLSNPFSLCTRLTFARNKSNFPLELHDASNSLDDGEAAFRNPRRARETEIPFLTAAAPPLCFSRPSSLAQVFR